MRGRRRPAIEAGAAACAAHRRKRHSIHQTGRDVMPQRSKHRVSTRIGLAARRTAQTQGEWHHANGIPIRLVSRRIFDIRTP
ncbi:hypothetical protein C0Z17_01305 [Trinickia caryophylli]|nr:hypothetical protein C0Z17_01305 [Trinickia caryophylli]